ncbi:hypothetical protein OUZ56_016436 [Daphnia magna]|uniref:Tektin n=1 Tax=Daphnia magna TaxID=35525 RepID=A0ABR0AQI3_9CRUS|nr:hypothetical protein OUZ56_016436 [Daphnia magna]
MAQNLSPSVSSIKEKLKNSRGREEECAANLHLHRQDLLRTRTAAIDVVLDHQKAIVQLDQELEENSKDIKNLCWIPVKRKEESSRSSTGRLTICRAPSHPDDRVFPEDTPQLAGHGVLRPQDPGM